MAESEPILPDVVLPELAYMMLRELGYSALIRFLNSISAGELVMEKMILADLTRTAEILAKYADSPGFVESFERGRKDIAAGRVTPVSHLKRKY